MIEKQMDDSLGDCTADGCIFHEVSGIAVAQPHALGVAFRFTPRPLLRPATEVKYVQVRHASNLADTVIRIDRHQIAGCVG
jgi:hypothetical protein